MSEYKSLVNKISISPEGKTKQKEYLKKGALAVVDQGQELVGGYTDDTRKTINCDLPVIVFGDHTRAVKYISFPFGAGADGIKVLQPKETVLPKFLYYGTQYLVAKMPNRGYARHYQFLEKMNLPTPPLSEQQRIVAHIEELFSQLDSGVETLRKTKQQLAVYRQAVLKEAFNPKQDWKFAMASEIGEVCLGRQRSPDNISNLYPTKYIRAANITESGIDAHDVLEMEFTPAERDKYYLRYNDIVISEASGSKTQVGKPALWKGEIENCCFQNTVIRHRVEHQNPTFIFWQYKFLYLSGYFAREVGGVGINHIGAKNFSRIRLAIAPIGKQNAIVEKIESQLSACDSIEQTVDAALQQAEALRQSILKQAFEGGL